MSEAAIAVPSKGRLKDEAFALFTRAGLPLIIDDPRGYEARCAALPELRVLLQPAGDIAAQLKRGVFAAGLTGEDVLREQFGFLGGAGDLGPLRIGTEGPVRVCRLGFGPARLVTAVPESWLDAERMDDVREIAEEIRAQQQRPLRAATKYQRLTRAFFARHLISDYRIIASAGATEAAPASGLADLIVDITTSGDTLRANRLKILSDGTLFASEAALFLNAGAAAAPVLRAVTARLAAAAGQDENARLAFAML